jgi:beta-lactamase regulating signal transducer with metallopeptidase domain
MNKKGLLAKWIGGFVAILIGVSLIGPISKQINRASNYTNPSIGINQSLTEASSWGAAVLNLVPGFFALVILCVVISIVYSSLRSSLRSDDNNKKEEEEEEEETNEDEEEEKVRERNYSYSVKKEATAAVAVDEPIAEVKAGEIKEREKKFVKSKYD